jgi:hypothetical protein
MSVKARFAALSGETCQRTFGFGARGSLRLWASTKPTTGNRRARYAGRAGASRRGRRWTPPYTRARSRIGRRRRSP